MIESDPFRRRDSRPGNGRDRVLTDRVGQGEVGAVTVSRRRLDYGSKRHRPAARPSRLVASMKLLLPAIALLMAGLVVSWSQFFLEGDQFQIGDSTLTVEHVDGLVMNNPRFVGTDSQQRPYQIQAVTASQRSKSDVFVHLTAPKADMLFSEKGWVAMTARSGIYDRANDLVDLEGDVALIHHDGFQFFSERVRLNLRDATVEGDRPIRGQGQGGEIISEGFEILDRGTRVRFLGHSQVRLPGIGGGG